LIEKRILVVDDDESVRWVTQVQLQQKGFSVSVASDAVQALDCIHGTPPDLVITDLKMPGMSGLELLKKIRAEYPEIMVIMVTAFGTVENAVDAMKAGAYDYITKPVNRDELLLTVSRALEHLNLREEVRNLRSSLDKKYGFENILGQSKVLLYVSFAKIASAARSLRCHAFVTVMKTAELRDCDNLTDTRDLPREGTLLVEPQMGSGPMVVTEIRSQGSL